MVKVFFNRDKVNKSEPMLLNVLYTYISASILPPISNASKDLRMVSSSSVPIVKIMRWLVEMKDRKTRYIKCLYLLNHLFRTCLICYLTLHLVIGRSHGQDKIHKDRNGNPVKDDIAKR